MQNNVLFFKISGGGRSRSQLLSKIASIDAIIDSLLTTALVSVGNGHMVEYEINTGQTTQKVQYSTPNQITNAVLEYEKIRQYYENKLIPRGVQLMDSSNFRRPY